MDKTAGRSPLDMVFGLSREEDERSLAAFLQLFSRSEFTSVLIPRLEEEEIQGLVHLLTAVMRNHLSEREYHELFLTEQNHPH